MRNIKRQIKILRRKIQLTFRVFKEISTLKGDDFQYLPIHLSIYTPIENKGHIGYTANFKTKEDAKFFYDRLSFKQNERMSSNLW